jgi:hypothetical protein
MSKKLTIVIGLLAALIVPAGAIAGEPTDEDAKNASKECKALRGTTDASREAFKQIYKNLGKCVSQKAREEAAERKDARTNAAKECKAEREADPAAFQEKYGKNKNGKNAFGKCVSEKAKAKKAEMDAEDKQEAKEFKNAAKECKAEREADPAAFREKYGKNKNGKNAFGKCVSSKTKESDD